jgi:hypothetical protein
MRSDEEILKGFLEGDADAFRELLIRFQPAFIKKLSLHHAGLWSQRAEILDAAETRLFEWRRKHLQGEPRFHPGETIQALAWRLAKQEAKLEGAFVKRDQWAKEWGATSRRPAVAETLPPAHGSRVAAKRPSEIGDPPPYPPPRFAMGRTSLISCPPCRRPTA